MASLFWNNLEKARKNAGIERKAIEKGCGLANNAFSQGLRRNSSPSVDLSYHLAKTVGMTIEELVDGGAGLEYVLRIVRNNPRAVRVPDRIFPVVEYLLLLDDKELRAILANVKELASDKKRLSREQQRLLVKR
jgi:transcriptional regulator with XRE-family HTH domain